MNKTNKEALLEDIFKADSSLIKRAKKILQK